MAFYAAHNTSADLNNGKRGFLDTWEISRFTTRAKRDAFVKHWGNFLAKPVTRKEAKDIFDGCYISVGREVPKGGLFASDAYGMSRFWNENQ